jgi:hypothetical protein
MSSLSGSWHSPAGIQPSPNNSRFNSSQQAWATHFDSTSPYSSRHRWMMLSSSLGPTISDCCRVARVHRLHHGARATRPHDTRNQWGPCRRLHRGSPWQQHPHLRQRSSVLRWLRSPNDVRITSASIVTNFALSDTNNSADSCSSWKLFKRMVIAGTRGSTAPSRPYPSQRSQEHNHEQDARCKCTSLSKVQSCVRC